MYSIKKLLSLKYTKLKIYNVFNLCCLSKVILIPHRHKSGVDKICNSEDQHSTFSGDNTVRNTADWKIKSRAIIK